MNILIDIALPHTKEHYEITSEYLVCPTGEAYVIADLDLDLLDDWLDQDVNHDLLQFTIIADIKEFDYKYEVFGCIDNGMKNKIREQIEITSCILPGVDSDYYEPRANQTTKTEAEIIKLIEGLK